VQQTKLIMTLLAFAAIGPARLAAQPPLPPQPELDRLVDRIALYPDSLLSNVLAAATFPDQILDAEGWAHRHTYLRGDGLARAIADDHLWFDPSVQALLPFPTVLELMANDMDWTRRLGDAFLANSGAVMDTVQRLRHRAWDYGYLRPTPQVLVRNGPFIEIVSAQPDYYYVPVYNPGVVFVAPRPGVRVNAFISFGPAVVLGGAFRPWGWYEGGNHFAWDRHVVVINNRPWERTYVNRTTYVHPYTAPRYEQHIERREIHERREGPPPRVVERHEEKGRDRNDRHN
jgi:Protein of unknown function (DUF3300)